ncbi:MAG: HEAT repeat domain-containing protein [Aggregatilineales bacterium]
MSEAQAKARERQINAMIDQLSSPRASERREAAYWLGEAAVGDAVPLLVALYQNDDDRGVREAAAYALGMFRAVEDALKQGQEDRVIRLLEQVENEGKLGKRANKRGLVRLLLGLTLSFALLAAAAALLPDETVDAALEAAGLEQALAALGPAEPATTPASAALDGAGAVDESRSRIAADLRASYAQISADATTLQNQFLAVLGGGTLDCTAFFNNPPPVEPERAAAYPELAALASQLAGAQTDLAAARARYDGACDGVQLLPVEDVGPVYGIVIRTLRALPEIEAALSAAERGQPGSPPPTATPVPTNTPTPTQTPPPTTEISIANPRMHLAGLYSLIDTMTGQRGQLTLLGQYWRDVQQAGRTDGCNQPLPPIPADYSLPLQDARAAPALGQAVELINQGLELTRVGWADFLIACGSRELAPGISDGLALYTTALTAFQAATQLLDSVRDGL